MNEEFFTELSAWLTEAGLASTPETAIASGFCDRRVAAGLPLARRLLAANLHLKSLAAIRCRDAARVEIDCDGAARCATGLEASLAPARPPSPDQWPFAGSNDQMTQIVAAKIIELAQCGVRDHDALLKMTLQEFRSPK